MKREFRGTLWDAHVHLFPERLMQAIFQYFRKRYNWVLPFPTGADALLDILKEQGVQRSFALAYVHKPGMAREVNKWLADFCMSNKQLIPFGAVHPLDEDLKMILHEALTLYNFPGLKLHCLVQDIRPDDRRLDQVYKMLTERNKCAIIHASSFPMPAQDRLGIKYVSRLLARHPNLKLIIPHLGLYELQGYRELLGEHPGLYLDTSFVFQNKDFQPQANEFASLLDEFPERILYGSDFPFILEPPENGIARILKLGLPADLLSRLFYQNAADLIESLEA